MVTSGSLSKNLLERNQRRFLCHITYMYKLVVRAYVREQIREDFT
jgi:hypothetical protein